MDSELKKTLKAVTLELRHLLEGRYDSAGKWKPGDLEQRLAAIGVRRDRASVPVDELRHLAPEDRQARKVVDAYLKLRQEAGVERSDGVAEFVRETAYTWANRLLALRCMEARELIDSVILQQEAYGGRSLEHHRLAQRHPELCSGDDDGLFAVLEKVFREQAKRLPMLFDPQAPGIALRPAPAALKDCFGLLSLDPDTLRKYRIRLKEDETASAGAELPNPFTAPDALGWAYQYWNTEEKERVFTKVRTQRAKIEGADIVPATQLYTEPYMVKFLVQNSLGATWMGMHPDSRLAEGWEYYVRDADRAPVAPKPVVEITLLDPAVGSGHFLLEAFDLFWEMHEEEGTVEEPEAIAAAILNDNLFGIDIDERAVQIAQTALWMKAQERAPELSAEALTGFRDHLVACNIRLPRGDDHVRVFLEKHPEDMPIRHALPAIFEGLANASELGSLLRVEEIVEDEIAAMRRTDPLFAYSMAAEGWGSRIMARLREHFEAEGQVADLVQAFFGRAASKGLALLDLLAHRYDVVTANPPWMGSKNMGLVVKRYVERQYDPGKRDIYAAFILRCLELARNRGRVAMVTQQTWMFLRSFAELRASETPSSEFRGLLVESSIEVMAQLGRYAFSELGNGVIQPQLFVVRKERKEDHVMFCLRLSAPRASQEQAQVLQSGASGRNTPIVSRPLQKRLLGLPSSPLCFWLRDHFFDLLTGRTLGDVADVCQGLATANDPRFVRFSWEGLHCGRAPSTGYRRWFPFEKGGGYGKWCGHQFWIVDWQHSGARIKASDGPRVQNEQHYFKKGWSYSYMARGCLGVRRLDASSISSHLAPGIFFHDDVLGRGAMINGRLSSYIVRSISAKTQLNESYVCRLPVTFDIPEGLLELESACVSLKLGLVTSDPTELTFDRGSFSVAQVEVFSAVLGALEGLAEKLVFAGLEVKGDDLAAVLDETGTPSGWHPLIFGYDAVPPLPDSFSAVLRDCLLGHPRRNLLPDELADLKRRLKAFYLAGFGGTVDGDHSEETADEDDESDDSIAVGARIPIPVETFIEELSTKLGVHPVSIYWLLNEGRLKEGWRCLPEQRRLLSVRITVTALRLLGHRWPKQIEVGEPVPDWADPDGIIPMTPLPKETTLFERVQERLRADDIDAKDFAEVMGKPLDAWLATEFFKHHTTQFKKRPIAWQLQSGKSTARTTPAFACLLYYHKLDVDALPKLRSQYVGPLRQRLETELRGIRAIAAEARSDRQVKRRAELDDSILELQRFDTILEAVAVAGFGPAPLHASLRQYAIDDAMLALKARWLRRLSQVIAESPLPDWLDEADHTDLHPDLRSWIADAMAHLDYTCARVGPKPPDQGKLASDPTSADLAKLITLQAHSMLKVALVLACDSWWKQFEEVVLGPDKDQIKTLKEEQKDCEEQMDADPAPSGAEARHLRSRVKEIKEAVKTLTARIKNRTARANELRTQIERWESKEPLGWGDWLAGQPLFDRISSLDGYRATPTTIAEFIAQESLYAPDINDGVRVNIAPLQKAGLLAADVLAAKDVDKAIADRAEWRADERRWVREGKLPQPGWWPEKGDRP